MNTATNYSQMSSSRTLAAYLGDIRFEFVKMLRTPAFAIPTLIFPVMFYLLFGVLMGSARGDMKFATYAFAAYGVFGTMAPGLFGFGVSLAFEREQGLLTFKQALPMPPGAYLLARMVMAMLFVSFIALMLIGMALTLGHVPLTFGQALRIYIVDVLGVLPFCAIGLAVGSLVSGQAAPAIVNLIYFPMAFLSGLWWPLQFMPKVLQELAPLWPAHHLAQLAHSAVGAPSVGTTFSHIAALVGVTVLFFWFAMRRLSNGGVRMFGASRPALGAPVRRVATVAIVWISIGLVIAGVMGGKAKVTAANTAATSGGSTDTKSGSAATDAAVPDAPVGVTAPADPLVAGFDADSVSAAYGEGMFAGGDDMRGGNSKATQRVISGGAGGSKGALEITGTIGDAIQYPFAGTVFFPNGMKEQAFMDYSGKQTLTFQARGDGRQYTVMFMAGLQVDGIPPMYYFAPGPEWQEFSIPLREYVNLDLKRVHMIAFGSQMPTGDFRFEIDNVQLR